MARKRESV